MPAPKPKPGPLVSLASEFSALAQAYSDAVLAVQVTQTAFDAQAAVESAAARVRELHAGAERIVRLQHGDLPGPRRNAQGGSGGCPSGQRSIVRVERTLSLHGGSRACEAFWKLAAKAGKAIRTRLRSLPATWSAAEGTPARDQHAAEWIVLCLDAARSGHTGLSLRTDPLGGGVPNSYPDLQGEFSCLAPDLLPLAAEFAQLLSAPMPREPDRPGSVVLGGLELDAASGQCIPRLPVATGTRRALEKIRDRLKRPTGVRIADALYSLPGALYGALVEARTLATASPGDRGHVSSGLTRLADEWTALTSDAVESVSRDVPEFGDAAFHSAFAEALAELAALVRRGLPVSDREWFAIADSLRTLGDRLRHAGQSPAHTTTPTDAALSPRTLQLLSHIAPFEQAGVALRDLPEALRDAELLAIANRRKWIAFTRQEPGIANLTWRPIDEDFFMADVLKHDDVGDHLTLIHLAAPGRTRLAQERERAAVQGMTPSATPQRGAVRTELHGADSDADYQPANRFPKELGSRLRMAARPDRKTKRVRSITLDGVVHYSMVDARHWWADALDD